MQTLRRFVARRKRGPEGAGERKAERARLLRQSALDIRSRIAELRARGYDRIGIVDSVVTIARDEEFPVTCGGRLASS